MQHPPDENWTALPEGPQPSDRELRGLLAVVTADAIEPLWLEFCREFDDSVIPDFPGWLRSRGHLG